MEFGLVKTIQSFKMSYLAHDVIVLFDKGKSTYRQALYKDREDDYKGNRDKLKAERTEEEQENWENFYAAQEAAQEAMEAAGIPVVCEYGIEADDWMALLSRKLYNKYDEIKIITTDKDILQLLNDKVSIFAYVQQQERDVAWLQENYTCTPQEFLRALILSGDKSDNVPGIVGLGEPKNAKARSITWAKKGETLKEIILAAGNVKGVIAKRVQDGKATILFAEKLVDLSIEGIIPKDVEERVFGRLADNFDISM